MHILYSLSKSIGLKWLEISYTIRGNMHIHKIIINITWAKMLIKGQLNKILVHIFWDQLWILIFI